MNFYGRKLKYLVVVFLGVFLSGCSDYNFEKDKLQVNKAMDEQVENWNKGDIQGYMKGYWQSDSLRFLGRRGLTYGWQNTLDNYIKGYPDKQTMGTLKFDPLSFDPLNEKQMFVVGKWTLEREKDTLRGYYSLLWKKFDGDWKIIFDHTN